MSQQYAPVQPQQAPGAGNGFGVAALVLGILAVVFGVIPIVGAVAFLLGPLAIIFGIVGITRKMRPRGTSIAGIVLGVVAMILAAVITAGLVGAFNSIDKSVQEAQASADATPAAPSDAATPAGSEAGAASSSNTVVYEVTSDGPTAGNISYATYDNGGMGQEQATDAPLPFTKEVDLGEDSFLETNIFSLVAQATDPATTISCKITVNGDVISEQTSTGQYSVVSCSGTPK